MRSRGRRTEEEWEKAGGRRKGSRGGEASRQLICTKIRCGRFYGDPATSTLRPFHCLRSDRPGDRIFRMLGHFGILGNSIDSFDRLSLLSQPILAINSHFFDSSRTGSCLRLFI